MTGRRTTGDKENPLYAQGIQGGLFVPGILWGVVRMDQENFQNNS